MFLISYVAVFLAFSMSKTMATAGKLHLDDTAKVAVTYYISESINLLRDDGNSLLINPITLDNRNFDTNSEDKTASTSFAQISIKPLATLTYKYTDGELTLFIENLEMTGSYRTTSITFLIKDRQGRFNLVANNVVIKYDVVTKVETDNPTIDLVLKSIEMDDRVPMKFKSESGGFISKLANIHLTWIGKSLFKHIKSPLVTYLSTNIETSINKLKERKTEFDKKHETHRDIHRQKSHRRG